MQYCLDITTDLNDCREEGGDAVARLPHPDLVEGDAAGGLCARVSALLVAVEPAAKGKIQPK